MNKYLLYICIINSLCMPIVKVIFLCGFYNTLEHQFSWNFNCCWTAPDRVENHWCSKALYTSRFFSTYHIEISGVFLEFFPCRFTDRIMWQINKSMRNFLHFSSPNAFCVLRRLLMNCQNSRFPFQWMFFFLLVFLVSFIYYSSLWIGYFLLGNVHSVLQDSNDIDVTWLCMVSFRRTLAGYSSCRHGTFACVYASQLASISD